MTKEEAIKIFNTVLLFGKCDCQKEDIEECFKMAIKALEQELQTFKWCTDCKEYDQEKHCCHRWSKVIRNTVEEMKQEPKTDIKLTNSEWIDFLAKQFDISRTSAKAMLHVMMSVKKEDNFKKQFSGRK